MNEIDILEKLVSFNTINDKENVKIIEYIENYVNKLGFRTIYKDKILIATNSKNNLEDVGLAFVGHTDTVGYKDWKYDPFKLTREGDKLIGLGTCDMKGGLACILQAISQVDFLKMNKKMMLVFTYDEEIGFSGIKDFLKLNLKMPEIIIVGEPTYNESFTGSKGLLEYKVEFLGKSAHSSTPFKGKNAIIDAVEFITQLKAFYEDNIKNIEDEDFDIPYTTFNIGTINGGQAINIVPDLCEIKFDFRTITGVEQKIDEYVKQLTNKYQGRITTINQIKAFKCKSKQSKENKMAPFITEASFLEGERIILGPGPMNPHEKNEYVEISSMEKTVKQYIKIIENKCNDKDF